jgi:small acid-soluble spore protein H (minor)
MIILDRERIEEIIDSKGVIEVTYHGNPVWIESMNRDDDDRVEIRNLDTDEMLNVKIEDLME